MSIIEESPPPPRREARMAAVELEIDEEEEEEASQLARAPRGRAVEVSEMIRVMRAIDAHT